MTQIDDAIDALYAGDPEDFVAARDELIARLRTDGDKAAVAEVRKLRRPTAAAGILNRLAGGTALAELARLGERSRTAQSKLDAAALRRLGGERNALTQRVLDAAQDGAGEPLSAAIREQIVATVTAAIADPGAADAVASGRLTKALSYSGFGEVDLTDAVAAWSSKRTERPAAAAKHSAEPAAKSPAVDRDDRARQKALAVAEERRDQASALLGQARDQLDRANQKVADAQRALAAAEAEVARLRP